MATNKSIVSNFIANIWNKNEFDKIDNYIHKDFIDHSLPPSYPANQEGLKLWITTTGKSFRHHTIIEEIICEQNKVMIKIKMILNHIGTWRDIEPTGSEIFAIGYRYFKMADDKIIEHWGLLDGNAIENQLKAAKHGCKTQE